MEEKSVESIINSFDEVSKAVIINADGGNSAAFIVPRLFVSRKEISKGSSVVTDSSRRAEPRFGCHLPCKLWISTSHGIYSFNAFIQSGSNGCNINAGCSCTRNAVVDFNCSVSCC